MFFCQEIWNCEGFLVNTWRAGRGSRYKSCRHILLTLVLRIFRPGRGGPGGDYGHGVRLTSEIQL